MDLRQPEKNKDGKNHCFANKALIRYVNKSPFTAPALTPSEGSPTASHTYTTQISAHSLYPTEA